MFYIAGRIVEASYECKICYSVDLILSYGYTYYYNHFNKFTHDSVLAKARGNHDLAYEYLASRRCELFIMPIGRCFLGSTRILRTVLILDTPVSYYITVARNLEDRITLLITT